ncbi:hypothetical protein BGX30_010142 [Mortierella sp. GBA39]|nr:hypothetical protein BGX30_010142 [Mortierella sp. GBA39]
MLFLNMLLVLLATIVGTYLLFRITIGWLFYRYRKGRNGHLGLTNSLSLAPLMHRMKGNANSLTLITVLSAMTLTMVALTYSLYYSAGSDTRISLPYDVVFENDEQASASFRGDLQKAGISFVRTPVEALRVIGEIRDPAHPAETGAQGLLFLPAEQLKAAGADIAVPGAGEAWLFDGRARLNALGSQDDSNEPKQIVLETNGKSQVLRLTESVDKFAMNYNVYGAQIVTSASTVKALKEKKGSLTKGETVTFDSYRFPDHAQQAKASALYAKYVAKDDFKPDFYSEYRAALQSFGLYIFISGFLGLVFLVSTGSILYFKQIAEAEEEKRSFVTLRQLGFDVKDIMRGVARKQLFVFAIPLVIGLMHSIFAVKAASVLVLSSIALPSAIAMGAVQQQRKGAIDMKKGGAVAALIIIILAVFLVMSARDVVDRFNPLVPQEDVFVRIDKPAENDNGRYKYELTGYNSEGEKKKVIFTSSTQLPEGTYLKVMAKGAYTESYTKVKKEDVPRDITW